MESIITYLRTDADGPGLSNDTAFQNRGPIDGRQTSSSAPEESRTSFRRVVSDTTLSKKSRTTRRRSTRKSSEMPNQAAPASTSLNLRCDELLLESPTLRSTENFFPKDDVPSSRSRSMVNVLGSNTSFNIMGPAFELQRPSRKRPSPDALLNNAQRQSVLAQLDKAFHFDSRCLRSMLDSELVIPAKRARPNAQRMRLQTIEWLSEVCVETNCDAVVLPLAISFMDRFLAAQPVPILNYQALGASCLLLASKMKAPIPLSPKRICDYSNYGVSISKILEFEIAIVNKLSWDLCTSTPFEFFDQLLARMPVLENVRMKTAQAIYAVFKDEALAMQPPSAQAALSVLFAVDDYVLEHRGNHQTLLDRVEATIRDEFQYEIETLREVLASAMARGTFFVAERHISERVAQQVLQEDEQVVVIPSSEYASFVTPSEDARSYHPRSVKTFPTQCSDLSPSLYTRTEMMFSRASSLSDTFETPSSIVDSRTEHRRYVSDDSGFNSEVTTPEMAKTTTVLTTTYASDVIYSHPSHTNPYWRHLNDSF